MRKLTYYASLCLIASIPATNGDMTGGLSEIGSVHRFLGLLTLLLWTIHMAISGKLRRPHAFHGIALAFVMWNVVSLAWSMDADLTAVRVFRLIQSVGFTLILWDLYRTENAVAHAFQSYVFGAYAVILATAWHAHSGVQTNRWDGRFAANGFDPNDLGLTLMMGVPMAWYLAMTKRDGSRVLRTLNFIFPLAALAALVLTASRGAMLAGVPALLLILFSARRLSAPWRIALATVLIGVFVAVAQFHLVPRSQRLANSLQRLETTATSASDDGFTGRLDIWRAGRAIFSEHPVLGVGGGAFPASAAPYGIHTSTSGELVAHNTYLSVATELGLGGFTLFGALLWVVVQTIFRQPDPRRGVFLAIFLVWALGVFGMTWEYRAQTWLALVLILIGSHCTTPAREVAAKVMAKGERERGLAPQLI